VENGQLTEGTLTYFSSLIWSASVVNLPCFQEEMMVKEIPIKIRELGKVTNQVYSAAVDMHVDCT